MKMKKIIVAVVAGLLSCTTLYAANEKPVDISADVLEYDTESGLISGTGSVKMIQEGAVLTGNSAEYNNKTQQGQVIGNVVYTRTDLQMTAAKVMVGENNNHVVAVGDVVVKQLDRILTGPQMEYYMDREVAIVPSEARLTTNDGVITANRMEAYMKDNHVIATGSVHIVSDTRQLDATGDRADYFSADKGKVILSGNAVAVQGNNTMRGNRLTLYLMGEQKK